MGRKQTSPRCAAVIHLHGGRTPAASDGYPEDWVVPGKSQTCHYPNKQDAALLFYHDHTMGINRLNIYAGMQGLFVVRDEAEDALNLPKGKYEVPLLLCDRLAAHGRAVGISGVGASEVAMGAGGLRQCDAGQRKAALLISTWSRGKYRFRVMNGSNARFFRLSFGKLPEMHQIGSDQGLLAAPVKMKRVLLAPAERADIVVRLQRAWRARRLC